MNTVQVVRVELFNTDWFVKLVGQIMSAILIDASQIGGSNTHFSCECNDTVFAIQDMKVFKFQMSHMGIT